MRLVILDANALIHRAYHALPSLSNVRGEPTGAIYGFFSSFIRMVNDLKPDYLVAAFDTPELTFRHKEFKAYKAHRPKTPPDLAVQLKRVREALVQIGILTLEKDGYEADDIIGTITFQLKSKIKNLIPKEWRSSISKPQSKNLKDLEIIIVTGDLDTLQLVREGVKVYTMKRGISDIMIYDENAVKERFGLKPSQLPDYKGLTGDPSDNIPGVTGIGPKTATGLLQKFKSLESLFKSKEVPEKLQGKQDQAIFSKELATINTKAPVPFDLQKAQWKGFDISKIEKLFTDLGFQSLLRRIIQSPSQTQTTLFDRIKVSRGLSPVQRQSDDRELSRIAFWLLNPAKKSEESKESLASLKEQLKREGIITVFETIEAPLVPILRKMEKEGVKVDTKALRLLELDLKKELYALRQEIVRMGQGEFNPSSPDQLRLVLFEKLKIPSIGLKKTPGGKISTKESELSKIASQHQIVPSILHYRELEKLLTTYVTPLFQKIGRDGRVHTTFNQAGTTTGRLASQNPNLQNIPVQGDWAIRFKNVFIAQRGFLFASFDYSQIELRVAAHLAGDDDLINAFRNDEDIHTHTAAEVFSIEPSEVTPAMRRLAKVFNFGILYGLSSHGLAENLRVTREEAQDFIDNYFARFPGIKRYIEKTKEEVVANGFVKTIFGRKRWFNELKHPETLPRKAREAMLREAVNMPIQGSAADIVKLAMTGVNKEVIEKSSGKVRLLLQIHDDLLFEVKQGKLKEYIPKIKDAMEGVVILGVPLRVEVKVGAKWGELS